MKMNFSYDEVSDVLMIEGVRYSGELFRDYFSFPTAEGYWWRTISNEDGIVCVRRESEEQIAKRFLNGKAV